MLLWRQGDQWRGKVSDYGTPNFMQQTMTVAPGAMFYIAPEALTPNQTIKVGYDWYYTSAYCESKIGKLFIRGTECKLFIANNQSRVNNQGAAYLFVYYHFRLSTQ